MFGDDLPAYYAELCFSRLNQLNMFEVPTQSVNAGFILYICCTPQEENRNEKYFHYITDVIRRFNLT